MSDQSVEIAWIAFAYGYCTHPPDSWNIPTKSNERDLYRWSLWTWSCFYPLKLLIWYWFLMDYVYNVKEFAGETPIS